MIVVTAADVAEFGLAVGLIGSDGSEWDLVDGPVRLSSGATGLGMGDFEHWWLDSPMLDGSIRTGGRFPRGEAHLKVRVRARSAQEMRDVHTAFVRACAPTAGPCYWRVSLPEQPARLMELWYEAGFKTSERSPFAQHALGYHASYELEFAQPDPFWRGPSQTVGIKPGRNVVATRTVEVPGDVAVWPKWSIPGPVFGTTTVGVGDSFVTLTLGISVLGARTIDMDPRQTDGYAVRDQLGASKWSEVGDRKFAPIPPGLSEVQAGTNVSGSALPEGYEFSLSFTPGYWQAW